MKNKFYIKDANTCMRAEIKMSGSHTKSMQKLGEIPKTACAFTTVQRKSEVLNPEQFDVMMA